MDIDNKIGTCPKCGCYTTKIGDGQVCSNGLCGWREIEFTIEYAGTTGGYTTCKIKAHQTAKQAQQGKE